MITEFAISNFKALRMESGIRFQPRLNVLIGLNGSGKSSLLQGIDFTCSLVQTDGLNRWLERRGWTLADIPTRLSASPRSYTLVTSAVFDNAQTERFRWTAHTSLQENVRRCVEESFFSHPENRKIAFLNSRKASYLDNGFSPIMHQDMRDLAYSGSFLSVWKPGKMADVRDAISACSSLDLLSPHLMRSHVKKAPEHGIGLGGEFIAHFLNSLKADEKKSFDDTIRRFYPSYDSFKIKTIQGGALVLNVKEKFANGNECTSEATMLCDGILRIMAIVAQAMANKGGTILIDELEDGLNPELLEKLVIYLATEAPCQTIITTHSPLILSLLTIKEAEQGVYLVYKDGTGVANCVPFFSLPSPKKMLASFYPGEVMLRCNLETITKEAIEYAGRIH